VVVRERYAGMMQFQINWAKRWF